MLLDLKFSIGTLGIGSGAFVASLYGMNLKNFLEESDLGFWGVSAWSALFAAFVWAYGLKKLRRVQRVSMWGERTGGSSITGGGGSNHNHNTNSANGWGRAGWRDVRMLGEGRVERDRTERVKRIKELKKEAWSEARELKALEAGRGNEKRKE